MVDLRGIIVAKTLKLDLCIGDYFWVIIMIIVNVEQKYLNSWEPRQLVADRER